MVRSVDKILVNKISVDQAINIRQLGLQEYLPCWQAMQAFTHQRNEETIDELWLLEHPPVFTLGQNGQTQHILHAGDISIVHIDRGGQVTYHGPGQLVVYTLIDIKRKKFSIRQFVSRLEQSVIELLSQYHIRAEAKCEAPGVYVHNKKICSIGLRIRRGYAFHGLALNLAMNLEPFSRINPCGYTGLQMTQISEWTECTDAQEVGIKLVNCLMKKLEYTEIFDMQDHYPSPPAHLD